MVNTEYFVADPLETPLRIFIADDSKAIHYYLGLALDLIPGVELVGCAHDALAAVAGVHVLRPDALILDVRMDLGLGLDVLKALQFDERPLIFVLTWRVSPALRRCCRSLGAHGIFDKEDDLPELLEAIETRNPPPVRLRALSGHREQQQTTRPQARRRS
jgi:DNA-binding NarL/FixJ family response regulator